MVEVLIVAGPNAAADSMLVEQAAEVGCDDAGAGAIFYLEAHEHSRVCLKKDFGC